ncbi:protease inhibitor [Streptomyces durmitorensis]|uniref:Probable subtilase-type protease inhibitor n=2 Tax=Streptomyces durmitorensis TaxID=319947 RepID=A0ABY4PMJ8_9ACTN|nr:subtilase-type protease inhibitor [Streptomyces durmitorensis]UQT54276.1 subtilase-type protease inhibitor [Streptomyces durmitorensis]
MRFFLKTVGATAVVAACVMSGTSGTAQAQPKAAAAGLYAPSSLVLAVGQGEEADTAIMERAVTLNCLPKASGTHPTPSAACAELRAVDGQFAQLVGTSPGMACTKEWKPVVVAVDGVWQGRRVAWSQTFGNSCEMRAGLAGGAALAF